MKNPEDVSLATKSRSQPTESVRTVRTFVRLIFCDLGLSSLCNYTIRGSSSVVAATNSADMVSCFRLLPGPTLRFPNGASRPTVNIRTSEGLSDLRNSAHAAPERLRAGRTFFSCWCCMYMSFHRGTFFEALCHLRRVPRRKPVSSYPTI